MVLYNFSLFFFHILKHQENLIPGYLEYLWHTTFSQLNECWKLAPKIIQLIEYISGLTQWLCLNLGLLHW